MRLKKIYSVSIVYFDIGQGTDYLYSGKMSFTGVYDNDILYLSDMQRKIYGGIEAGDIHPHYYVLKINKFNSVSKNTLDEWFYFLKHDKIKEGFSAKGLLKARDILDYNRLSPEERANYDYEQNVKSHQLSQVASGIDLANFAAEKKYAPIIEEKDKALEEKDKALEEQAKALEEKDKALEEQAKALEEKAKALAKQAKALEEQAKENAELKRLLNINKL